MVRPLTPCSRDWLASIRLKRKRALRHSHGASFTVLNIKADYFVVIVVVVVVVFDLIPIS